MCLALYTRHARLCAHEDAQTHHTTFARASRTRSRNNSKQLKLIQETINKQTFDQDVWETVKLKLEL